MNSSPPRPRNPRPARPSTSSAATTSRGGRRGPRPKSLPFALVPAVAAVACDPNNQTIHRPHAAADALPQSPPADGKPATNGTDHDLSATSCLPSPPSSSEPAVLLSPPPPVSPPSASPTSPGFAKPDTTSTRPAAVHPFFQPRRKPDHPPSPANASAAPAVSEDIVDLTNDQSSPISPPAPPQKPVHPFFTRPSTAPAPDPEPALRRSTRRRRPTQSADDHDADPAALPPPSPKRKRARTASTTKQRKPAAAARKPASDDEFMSDGGDSDVMDADGIDETDPAVMEQARILAMIQARKRSDELMRKFYKPPAAAAESGSGEAVGGGFFAPKVRRLKVEEVVDADEVEVEVVEGEVRDRFSHPIRNTQGGSKVKEVPAPWPTSDNIHVGRPLPCQPTSSPSLEFATRTCTSSLDTAHIPPWLLADLRAPLPPTLSAAPPTTLDSPPAPPPDPVLWTEKYAPHSVLDLCDSPLRHAGRQILTWLQEQLSASGSERVGAPKHVRDRIAGKRARGELDDFVVEDSDVSEIDDDNEDVDVVGSASDRADEAEDEEQAYEERDPSDDDDFIGPSTSAARHRRRNPHAPRAPAPKSKPRYGPGALLLSGPAGAGKSALLHALCAHLSLTLFEVHAGHRRAAKDIEHLLGQVADTHTVRAPIGAGGVLVVDAANVVFDEDRSMWVGVASVAVKTRRPLVIVVDDGKEGEVPGELVHVGLRVRVERPGVEAVSRRVAAVLRRERPAVEWGEQAVRRVVAGRGAGGRADLRAALMQVQFESARPAVDGTADVDAQAGLADHEQDLDALIQRLDARAACDVLELAVDRAIPYRTDPELPPATHPDSLAVDLDTTLVVPSCVMYHQAAVAVDTTVEWIRYLSPRHTDAPVDVQAVPDPPALVKIMHTWTGCQRSGAPTATPTGMRVDIVPAIAHLARLDLACMDEAEMAMAAAASGGARRTRRRMYKPAVRLEGVKREELEEIVAHRSVFCVGEDEYAHPPVVDLEVGLLD